MKRKAAAIAITVSLLAAMVGTTAAQSPAIPAEDGVYAVRRLSDRSEPGLLPVTTASGPRWAQVGDRAQVAIPSVRSMNSANIATVTIEGAAVHQSKAWTFTASCSSEKSAMEGLAITLERIAGLRKEKG